MTNGEVHSHSYTAPSHSKHSPAHDPSRPASEDDFDLYHHGDLDAQSGLLDLAVNVTTRGMPDWLYDALRGALDDLRAYPHADAATAAVAQSHGVPSSHVLLTIGAAEAFTLIAGNIPQGQSVVVHPQFTEPERALRAYERPVSRHLLVGGDFRLYPETVAPADMIWVGNPTNPTGVLHSLECLHALRERCRVLVVDEAFIDAVPNSEQHSMIGAGSLRGLLITRSFTKTWGLAGLRVGYVLGDPELIAVLRDRQPRWALSTLALRAAEVCSSPTAMGMAAHRAVALEQLRETFRGQLSQRGVQSVPGARAPFLLLRDTAGRDLVQLARNHAIAVRPAHTFPGLDTSWARVAIREDGAHQRLLDALDNPR